MKVFCYRNLHKQCWSVRAEEGPDKGRVIAHKDAVLITGATFRVGKAGQQRVVREGRKNVHAGVVGTYKEHQPAALIALPSRSERVSYNPYRAPSFYRVEDGSDVSKASVVLLNGAGQVFAHEPR